MPSKKRSASPHTSPFASPARPSGNKKIKQNDEPEHAVQDPHEETISPVESQELPVGSNAELSDTQFAATQAGSSQAVAFPDSSDSQTEITTGVWGYLINTKDVRQTTVFKKRQSNGQNTSSQVDGKTAGYIIGRHRECDVVVPGLTVSNRHCVIYPEFGQDGTVAVLEDLSSNGTAVGGVVVGRNKTRKLKDGDEIELTGSDMFIFRYPKHRFQGRFEENYAIGDLLGQGHFAKVFKATDRATGELVAVKKFMNRTRTSSFEQEVGVLMSVNHKNILVLKEMFDERDAVYLVLEMAQKGELFNHIADNGYIEEEDCRKIFVQLFDGLKYLHDRGIVHRDIKPENILVMDDKWSVKLADFGLAKIIGEDSFTTSLCGTPSYVAPEVLKNSVPRQYSKPVDIWSLGVVLYVCLVGFPPFSDDLYSPEYPYTQNQQILEAKYDFPSPYWDRIEDPALDLITRMLRLDPDTRIKLDDAFRHPWFYASKNSEITERLVGSFQKLDFTRKKVVRQRTLISEESRIAPRSRPVSEAPEINPSVEEPLFPDTQASVTMSFMSDGGVPAVPKAPLPNIEIEDVTTDNEEEANGEDGDKKE